MGQNLALNIESRGFSVAIYNRTASTLHTFLDRSGTGKRLQPCFTLTELVSTLRRPRRILLMVKAGAAVDAMIAKLQPLLDPGDVIIDGGNSFFVDTTRRYHAATEAGLLYLGAGVSGGEEGALHGPSIMPGGSEEAYRIVSPILTEISARVDDRCCCTYIGAEGAGHYVKMVHNGIEYGDMQLIAESFFLLQQLCGMDYSEMHDLFSSWNRRDLDSYLIEITARILEVSDPETGEPMVEMILDKAGQKGTGKWTGIDALQLGAPVTTITEAVYSRALSFLKDERVAASAHLSGPDARFDGDPKAFLDDLRQALYAAKICSYAQGYQLLSMAASEHHWQLNYGDIALMWRGGCIIRAQFLSRIKQAFDADPGLANLLLAPYFQQAIASSQGAWRRTVAHAVSLGIPVPAFSSALAYYDGYRSAELPANLLQAQRDYFGAHTYHKINSDGDIIVDTDGEPVVFHTEWMLEDRPEIEV